MIIEELVARLGFSVEGLEKLRRAAEAFKRLTRAIALFAISIAKRLGRVALVLARVSAGLLRFGAGFIARSALITGAAGLATAALMKLAAGFAKVRQETIDSARVGGVPIKELALIENVMRRVGASAEDGRKFVKSFTDKLREGVKDGGDWAETLGKAGVKIKGAKGQAKAYSVVVDDILKAAAKMKDPEKRRAFLTEALEGAPDQLMSQLLAATNAFEMWKSIVNETVKLSGKPIDGDILNAEDITTGLNRVQGVLQGFKEAFGSGLMAGFSQEFRKLGEFLRDLPLDDIRTKIRSFGGGLAEFLKSVTEGGFIVLSKVGEALGSIVDALARADNAAGGKLKMIAVGLGALGAALAAMAGGPVLIVSTAITGLLFAIAKFQEWKAGTSNVLSDFFDTIAGAAGKAKDAVDGLINTIRSMPGIGEIISPKVDPNAAPTGTAAEARRKTIQQLPGRLDALKGGADASGGPTWGGILQSLKDLFAKQAEMSPDRQTQKIAADRAASTINNDNSTTTNEQKNSFSVSVTANGLGEVAAAAASGVKAAAANIRMMTATSGGSAP